MQLKKLPKKSVIGRTFGGETITYWTFLEKKSEDKASLKSKDAGFLLVKRLKQLLYTVDETKREYYVCIISLYVHIFSYPCISNYIRHNPS